MLTTAPYLRTRGAPDAREFIISTLPPLTIPLRIALYTLHLLRVVLGLGVLLLLYSIWTLSPYGSPPPPATGYRITSERSTCPAYTSTSSLPLPSKAQIQDFLAAALSSVPGRLCTHIAKAAPAWILVPAAVAWLYTLTLRIHTEERLLVLRGLGVQASSTKDTLLGGGATTRFIPADKIQDVVINEAFRGFRPISYLVVVVEGEADVVVVFPKLLPHKRVVEQVWRGVKDCLYERPRGRNWALDADGKV
ncbi:Uu.00g072930.m01.CDS01 [Anthostomella pinea]|uniref:Uu.00g072930.m01.CDS01 n=1 Tax=Anthostomella pinea TaxID=933095 RepID=A0AAI8VWD9_9PEZI|nr:Uu.00g072930.m01.CDS01 [Anthostomella pinea]